jgi:hypothetical protein
MPAYQFILAMVLACYVLDPAHSGVGNLIAALD